MFDWSFFDVVSIRELFGMARRLNFRPGEGVRRGSGGLPNFIKTHIFIAIQTSAAILT